MTKRNRIMPLWMRRRHTFRRGDWAQVLSLEEIQATLDAEGKLEGMPFMPEMVKYCGRKFRVSRRAERVFLDHYFYVVKLKNTVFLEHLQCDGSAHDGCQMRCELFWKETWLKPADPPKKNEFVPVNMQLISLNLPTRNGNKFICQATEQIRASTRLHWWDVRQYVRDLMLGETTFRELIADLRIRGTSKVWRMFKRQSMQPPVANSKAQPTPTESLNLQPGEWVEVKSLEEIKATLDANGKNRGLGWVPIQADFCGKRYRVASRVERLIIEWTGEMKPVTNTVELDESHCHGRMCRSCPRNCYHLWREIWLRRVEGPNEPQIKQ